MIREIKKKKLILDNRKPFSVETQHLIEEMNQLDWIHSSLRLDGYSVNRESVGQILAGGFLVNQSINLHAAVSSLQQTIRLFAHMADMEMDLNEAAIQKVYQVMEQSSEVGYRKNNPILRMLNYNPPHFKEVDEQMSILVQWLHRDQSHINPIETAARFHNKLMEIYPFESGTEALARSLAQYQLIRNGLPPIQWNQSEQEYYDAIQVYLKNEDIQPIYDVLERGVYNKLEVMMQLTAD